MKTQTDLSRPLTENLLAEGAPEFHRLARTSVTYRWWKPLAVGVVAAGFYVVLVSAFFLVMALVGLAFPAAWVATNSFIDDPVTDFSQPAAYALGMVTVALILPSVLAAIRVLGAKPVGLVSSVTGRVRWGWLARCLLIAGVVYGAALPATAVLMSVRGESLAPRFDSSHTLALVGLALLLVPFQAAAEEYLFRGWLMQAVGAWFRHPAVAITLPVPLFVLGHGYEVVGTIDVAVFAFVAGWLTWRTGGLEAAIALHVVNNLAWSFLGAFGMVDLNATDASLTDLMVSLVMTVGFAIAAVRAADRLGVERTRT